MNSPVATLESTGPWAPLLFVALFLVASLLMIWRLEVMNAGGMEGTVLGTLIMPYCSGIGNLLFAIVLGRSGPGAEVMTNALVNNVTNMTLLLGLPAIFWGLTAVVPETGSTKRKRERQTEYRVNRLSLLLTLTAVLFFSGAVWALARDGQLDFADGLVLVGLFVFWQTFHVFEVLKSNARRRRSFGWTLPFDLALLAAGAYGTYLSIDWLVKWLSHVETGFISVKHLGWLSGWLMVLPNGLLALYYGRRGNPEIVYTSQVGDGHICIPLSVGVCALFQTFAVPAVFQTGMLVLTGATVVHLLCVALLGGLPRIMGWVFVATYGVFLYKGLLG